jgi:hypothetical protein
MFDDDLLHPTGSLAHGSFLRLFKFWPALAPQSVSGK